MNQTDIAFLMAGDLHRNIRALKQLRSLSKGGYSVKTFHLGGSPAKTKLPEGVEEEVVSVAPGRGPRFFQDLNRAFTAAMSSHSARLFHASDLYTLAAAAMAAKPINAHYSFDSRELYAHVASTRHRPWARWWWYRQEKRWIGGAVCVFTVSDSIADRLASTYGIVRPTVVHNVPEDVDVKLPDPARQNESFSTRTVPAQTMNDLLVDRDLASNVPVVVHLGQMKKDRGCKNLILAMKSVKKAHLVFLGFGPLEMKLRELVASHHLQDRVHFIAPVAPGAVNTALRGATIGVTMLEDTCLNHRFALPNKLFDYLKAGLPVLSSNLKEVNQIISEHQCGLSADPSSPADIARVLNQMLESNDLPMWSKNALTASETFSWDKATQRFMLEINRVLSPSQLS